MDDTSTFSDRSSMAISLWMSICRLPKLFSEVEDAICRPDDTDSLERQRLKYRLCHLQQSLLHWRRRYEGLLSEHFDHSWEQARVDKRYETLGVGLGMLLVSYRLIVAIDPKNASELEDEAQSIAHQILALEKNAYIANPRAGIFMAFKAVLANTTIATKSEWYEETLVRDSNQTASGCTISKDVFRHWCSLKGRKPPGHTRPSSRN